ncbi:MAG: HU family DNA-binding protein [Armatimonadetes bacterium]|nr:HU family DNA-binding protein [Armatimonadota bacterium]
MAASVTKAEVIEHVSKETGLSKRMATRALNSVLCCVKEALKKSQKVQLSPFGSFEVRKRAAREAVNPKTGGRIKIAAKRVAAFRPGKALKEGL